MRRIVLHTPDVEASIAPLGQGMRARADSCSGQRHTIKLMQVCCVGDSRALHKKASCQTSRQRQSGHLWWWHWQPILYDRHSSCAESCRNWSRCLLQGNQGATTWFFFSMLLYASMLMCMHAKCYGCFCNLKVLTSATCCMLTVHQLIINTVLGRLPLCIPNVHQVRVVWHSHAPTLCDFAMLVTNWTHSM